MLKIKDNVDLKELEKFGFKYRENFLIKYVKSFRASSLRIEPDNKSFYYSLDCNGDYDIENAYTFMIPKHLNDIKLDEIDLRNLIQDLIQAGLVEEVE